MQRCVNLMEILKVYISVLIQKERNLLKAMNSCGTLNFQKLYAAHPSLGFYDTYFLLLNVTVNIIPLHFLINSKLTCLRRQ